MSARSTAGPRRHRVGAPDPRWALILGAALLIPQATSAKIADDLLALTGGRRVKIVWARDTSAAGDNFFGGANTAKLYGYDTDDDDDDGNDGGDSDDGIRVILSSVDDYAKPMLTHDGENSWDPLKRVDLDNTATTELVWSQTQNRAQWLSISSDGARIAGSWPWNSCGVIVPDYDGSGGGDIYHANSGHNTTGCWTTITPDTTYRAGVFDGPHRNWNWYDSPTASQRTVNLNNAPGIDAWEIYHPKHSNDPRAELRRHGRRLGTGHRYRRGRHRRGFR